MRREPIVVWPHSVKGVTSMKGILSGGFFQDVSDNASNVVSIDTAKWAATLVSRWPGRMHSISKCAKAHRLIVPVCLPMKGPYRIAANHPDDVRCLLKVFMRGKPASKAGVRTTHVEWDRAIH